MAHGLLIATQHLQGVRKVVVGLGKPRIEGERMLIALDRLGMPPQSGERDAQMMMRIGGAPVGLDGAAKHLGSIAEPALLHPDEAEPIERIEVAIVGEEDFLIALLGLGELALIVQDRRLVERTPWIEDFAFRGQLVTQVKGLPLRSMAWQITPTSLELQDRSAAAIAQTARPRGRGDPALAHSNANPCGKARIPASAGMSGWGKFVTCRWRS